MTRTAVVLHAIAIAAIAILWSAVSGLIDVMRPQLLGRQIDWPSHDLGEMRHPDDRATIGEWGHRG